MPQQIWHGSSWQAQSNEQEVRHTGNVLRTILYTLMAITILYACISIFTRPHPGRVLTISFVELAIYGGMLWFSRRGYVRQVSLVLMIGLWFLLLFAATVSGGVAGIGYASLIGWVLAVGLLLGGRSALYGAGASVLAGVGLLVATQRGYLSEPLLPVNNVARWSEIALNLVVASVFLRVADGSLHRVQEALRRSAEQLRMALKAARVGAWEWHIPTNEVYWSDNVEQLFGLSPGTFPGTYEAYRSLIHEEDMVLVDQAIARTLEEDAPYWVEHRILWPDGSVHWLLGQGELTRDEDGLPLRLMGTVTDITLQRQAQEALRESEARYRAIVESTSDLICRFRMDTTLTFVNEAYCRYFGKTREELLGRPFLELVPEADHAAILSNIQRLAEERQVATYEHQVITPSGELRWQQWTDQPLLNERGEVVEFQSVGRDTTERRRVLEELEASLREKEVLIKEVHHRVKNNLQIVSSLLKLQTAQLTDPLAQVALRESRQRINSMAMIHEKLYRSSNLARIDFGPYVREMMAQLFRTYGAASRGITHRLAISDIHLDVDVAIPCGLIINELVTNALKHAFPDDAHGVITVSMRSVGDCYILTVADNGIGLPGGLDITQLDSLGLQLVHTLTAQLNGELEIDNNDGVVFTVRFQER